MSVADMPEVISFAGGFPDVKDFPAGRILKTTTHLMENSKATALQYASSHGDEALRKIIVELLESEKIYVDTDDMMITFGAQQGLDLLAKIFLNPGDIVLAESPTYLGALNAFITYQAQVVQIKMDKNGLIPKELEKTLKGLKKKPKFLYTVPSFQNPSGITLSETRRKSLVKIAKKYDLLIIEDNAYSALRFEGDPLPTLRSLDENIIFLGTFSKIFFIPGARLGWLVAPRAIMEKLLFAKQAADLCCGSLPQKLTEHYLTNYDWRKYAQKMIKKYTKKRDVMLAALKEHFPKEAKWTYPSGGFYIWVTLPEFLDTTEMLAEAVNEQKVAFVPGEGFYYREGGKNKMRLSYCLPSEKEIKEGIKRLAKVVKRNMEIYRSLER